MNDPVRITKGEYDLARFDRDDSVFVVREPGRPPAYYRQEKELSK